MLDFDVIWQLVVILWFALPSGVAFWKGYPPLHWLHSGGPLGAVVVAAFPAIDRGSQATRSVQLRKIAGRVGMGLWVVNLGLLCILAVHIVQTD